VSYDDSCSMSSSELNDYHPLIVEVNVYNGTNFIAPLIIN